jgi:gliding motility-associated-like protein
MPCLNTIKKVIEVKYNSVIADFDFINPALTYDANFINLSKNAQSFFWDFYDTHSSTEFEPSHTYEQVGSYTVCLAAINFMGCSDTLCKKIDVDAGWTFYVPNTFTPEGDNLNDIFFAYGTNIKDFKISVFDRWGENIFNSNDITKGWDGTFRGTPVQDDIYVWKADFNDLKNKNHSLTGHIQVLR